MVARWSGETGTFPSDSGSGPCSTVPSGPAWRSRMRGLKIVPPFAIAAYATANCIGVVRLKP